MNEILNKLMLARDKVIPEEYLTKPGFKFRFCGPLIKNEEKTQKFKVFSAIDILVNMHGLPLWKTKKLLQLPVNLKKNRWVWRKYTKQNMAR